MGETPQVVVAGHICLDVIPAFENAGKALDEMLAPGAMCLVGPAAISTGGAVSNTGVALHRLGVRTRLMGKVGDDELGSLTRFVLEGHGRGLSEGMLVSPGAASSYTVVVNPPGIDRIFLHYPGPNDSFGSEDLDFGALPADAVFHFGYPPLMRRMYSHGGRDLRLIFLLAKQRGMVTSLDLSCPDPSSDAGRAPWRRILADVLPYVDLFLPSEDEVRFMLGDSEPSALVAELLRMGAGIVVLKQGSDGLLARASDSFDRLSFLNTIGQLPASWRGWSLGQPAFVVEVQGTTGCGDSTVAGFLAALLRGLEPVECLRAAAAAGACAAERPDALSGVPSWEVLQARLAAGWPTRAAG